MADRSALMPLTEFQKEVARVLARNRTPDSHLAGGAALHFLPDSKRYSNDLDFFHDSADRVAEAYAADAAQLAKHGFHVDVEMSQPGFIRALVRKGTAATKIEWAHDSAWRFMPPIYNKLSGFQLHPIDVAANKALALAGRNEPRDLIDTLEIHRRMLPLGALCWAAVGKDPGFTPASLLELLKRRGKFRAEDLSKLRTVEPIDVVTLKQEWTAALVEAQSFLEEMPPEHIGCLYYSPRTKRFVAPSSRDEALSADVVTHFGKPGGVLPRFYDGDTLATAWQQADLVIK